EPDVEALRSLFFELEFSSLLKELLPVVEAKPGDYREIATIDELDQFLADAFGKPLAIAIPGDHSDSDPEEAEQEEETEQSALLPLEASAPAPPNILSRRIALSGSSGSGAIITLSEQSVFERIRRLLEDEHTPKAVHDLKSSLHHYAAQDIML